MTHTRRSLARSPNGICTIWQQVMLQEMSQGSPYLCLPSGIARGESDREQERKRSQVWDSPQPPVQPHPTHRHSLVQAAAVLPLLAQPGPAQLGLPGHVEI